MKWALLFLIILTITSCGLFRRSSSTLKLKDSYKLEKQEEAKNTRLSAESGSKVDLTKTLTNSKGSMKIYPTKGGDVKIDSQGNIFGSVDSIVKELDESTEQLNNVMEILNKTDSSEETVSLHLEIKEAQELKDKEKTKEPDRGGLAIAYSIIGVFVVIVILVVLRRR